MKIGDKVRFLSEVGGGKISGFQGKNIVLVEDEDGFEIPTPINDVVVVDNDDRAEAKIKSLEQAKEEREEGKSKSIKARLSGNTATTTSETEAGEEEIDYDPADNFVPQPREREGGSLFGVCANQATGAEQHRLRVVFGERQQLLYTLFIYGRHPKRMAMQGSGRNGTQHQTLHRAVLV